MSLVKNHHHALLARPSLRSQGTMMIFSPQTGNDLIP
jgi:hypothetical protein